VLNTQFYPIVIITLAYTLAILLAYRILKALRSYLKKTRMFKGSLSYRLNELKRETNQLCGELQRHRELKDALENKLERYSQLKEFIELLSSSLNLKDVVHYIIEETYKIFGKSERILLFTIDEQKQALKLAGSKKLDTTSISQSDKGDVFDMWVLEHRRPLIVSDTAKDHRFASHIKEISRSIDSMISAPMMLENRIMGILRLEILGGGSYTADDLRILCVIADISAVAMNNAYLYAKTEELAIKDSLTGLYVQRYFKDRLTEEMKRADRKECEFSLLMMDIDHFKYYNDKYGHAAGDVVLRHIAKSLNKFVDTGDVIARYGGEEFALILANETKAEAERIAERIRKYICRDTVMLRGRETHVTVSIGIATYPSDVTDGSALIKHADQNLYKAKSQGRDQVCS